MKMGSSKMMRLKGLKSVFSLIFLIGGVLLVYLLLADTTSYIVPSFLRSDWNKTGSITNVKALHHSQNETNLGKEAKTNTSNKLKNILCYSLYGADPRYTDGAIVNSKLYKEIYPGWTMRVYYDNTVPKNITDQLRAADVELVDMTGSKMNKMSWRFQGAADADRSCSRDIDSHLSLREKAAVDQWIQSGKKFHTMRDHPNHSLYPLSGGMWCSTTIQNIIELLTNVKSQSYLVDMNFLNQVLWPMAQKSVIQHDAFSCEKWGGGLPFPTERVGKEFVGSVYKNGRMLGGADSSHRKEIDEKCLKDNLPSTIKSETSAT